MHYTTLLKVAWRGLIRERRRSLITGLAIVFGLGLLIFTHHLSDSSYRHLLKQGIAVQAGHLVLQRPDDPQVKQSTRWLTQGQSVLEALKQGLESSFRLSESDDSTADQRPELHLVARMRMSGMLQSPTATARVMALGIDPISEPKVSQWHTQLVEAPLPSGEEGEPLKSAWLASDDTQGILLGLPLARQLDVTVGDKVVMTYQGKLEVQSFLFRVRGVVSTGAIGPDSMLAIGTIKGFQTALNEAQALHDITFHLSQLKALPDLQTEVTQLLTSAQISPLLEDDPYVLKDWKEALPALYQFTLKDRQSAMAVFIVIAIIIMIGILNTITMSVLERTRSFGVMLAIGISPPSVAGLILIESCLLGLFASIVGIGVGALFTWPLITYGIDFAALVGDQVQLEGVSFAVRLFAQWDWNTSLTFALYAWILTCCSGLWPAWRASRIAPTVALQQH